MDKKKQYALTLIALICLLAAAQAQDWPQWGLNPQHTGDVSVSGQPLNRQLADIVYDPLVPDEQAANAGNLLAHYQVPLIDGGNVFMEFKSGFYNKNNYATQIWGERGYSWINGQLTQNWSFTSDWTAPGSQADFWEPVFHGVLANGYIYVPGAGGTIFKLNKSDGSLVSRINPFSSIDPTIIVSSVLSVDSNGNIYYNTIQQFNPGVGISFYAHDIVDSWLVKVSPSDATQKVSYSKLTPGAPKATDQCLGTFSLASLPWPPSPTRSSRYLCLWDATSSLKRRSSDCSRWNHLHHYPYPRRQLFRSLRRHGGHQSEPNLEVVGFIP